MRRKIMDREICGKAKRRVGADTAVVPFPPPSLPEFTFIDLFAGIGGIRIAFQNVGGRCLFGSEIDRYARMTYFLNFGEIPCGDIRAVDAKNIPDHDILTGGFPCQAFSVAGKKAGFDDTRGTLFFEIVRIIKAKRPRAFFLENVKGLVCHGRGRTLQTILEVLGELTDYHVPPPRVINAKDFGVPQNRERIFIPGFRKDTDYKRFSFPEGTELKCSLSDVLEEKTETKYYLSDRYWSCLQTHKRNNSARGNGFGYEIIKPDGISNALVTGGMGRERNLIKDDALGVAACPDGKINPHGIRRLTPRECARLQGFPDTFRIEVSDTQAYRQFGNSVAIPAVQAVAERMAEVLCPGRKK
jgi:DNA (cytosine-5)-methyltransferase 1